MYKYRIKSTGGSTDKYGPCEVCGKHVSEVFHQVEAREYKPGSYTHHECGDWFGHEECLLKQRRN